MKSKKLKWQDISSYRQGQRGVAPPSTYALELGGYELYVTRYVGLSPTDWKMTLLSPQRNETASVVLTGDKSAKAAKRKAMKFAVSKLTSAADAIHSSVTQLNELLARNAAGVGWNVTAKKSKKSKK